MAAKLLLTAALAATALAAPLVEERQNCGSVWYVIYLSLLETGSCLTNTLMQDPVWRQWLAGLDLLCFRVDLRQAERLVLPVPSGWRGDDS
jgi:hypothetical protein